MDGNLVRTITIEGVENNDWEDIAKDKMVLLILVTLEIMIMIARI